jgi:hypothetical protein
MASKRRSWLIAFVGLGALVATAAVGAFPAAANHESHTGLHWICANGTILCERFDRINNPASNLTYYVQGSSLTANATYDIRWTPGVHTAPTDLNACHNGTTFNGGNAIKTGSTGSFAAKGPLSFSGVGPGQITTCAEPDQTSLPSNNFIGSTHVLWNVV